MHQIKIFKQLEFELESLERAVNQWLVENPVKVVNIFGNMSPQSPKSSSDSMINRTAHSPSDIMIVVVYEKD